jgi:DNA-binding HxlR family transcriptional regulator
MQNEMIEADNLSHENILSIRDALDILGGKWKIPILLCLRNGSKRFKELQQEIDGIIAKVLSHELKELEMNKIIIRKEHGDCPVIIEYSATAYCKSLKKIVEGLKEWGDHHRALIFNRPLLSLQKNNESIAL